LILEVVTQLYPYIKSHWIVHLKRVNSDVNYTSTKLHLNIIHPACHDGSVEIQSEALVELSWAEDLCSSQVMDWIISSGYLKVVWERRVFKMIREQD
jgi:hypothetical protein